MHMIDVLSISIIMNEFELLFLGLTDNTIQESIAGTGINRGTREQHLCRGIRLLRNVVHDKWAMPGKGILPTRDCFMVQIDLSYVCMWPCACCCNYSLSILIIHDTLANQMTHRIMDVYFIWIQYFASQPLAIKCLQWAGVALRVRNKRSPTRTILI